MMEMVECGRAGNGQGKKNSNYIEFDVSVTVHHIQVSQEERT